MSSKTKEQYGETLTVLYFKVEAKNNECQKSQSLLECSAAFFTIGKTKNKKTKKLEVTQMFFQWVNVYINSDPPMYWYIQHPGRISKALCIVQ